MSERRVTNPEQVDAAVEWDEYTQWEAEPWEDGKPPWMLGEPCPASVDEREIR